MVFHLPVSELTESSLVMGLCSAQFARSAGPQAGMPLQAAEEEHLTSSWEKAYETTAAARGDSASEKSTPELVEVSRFVSSKEAAGPS